jgi:decaprenylphospho-beta-D-ribofuranose 2-oxidase
MGLTGMISRAAFRLIPIETEAMTVDTRRDPDFLAVMQSLFDSDARHRYSVAWLDLSRHGRGRGVVMGADHASVNDVPRRRSGHTPLERTVSIPARCPRLVNELTVAAFNQMWYSRAPRRKRTSVESINSFFYPLDKISNWNRLYGRKGFLQYQFVVPYGEENTLVGVAEDLVATSTPISLAVLKRMGESDGGLISFPIPGWTLALDMPLGDPDLAAVLDGCDAKVARAGGRVYLAKDSRLRHEMVDQMYPNLSRWKEARERLDPDRRLRSNLSNRLGLTN